MMTPDKPKFPRLLTEYLPEDDNMKKLFWLQDSKLVKWSIDISPYAYLEEGDEFWKLVVAFWSHFGEIPTARMVDPNSIGRLSLGGLRKLCDLRLPEEVKNKVLRENVYTASASEELHD